MSRVKSNTPSDFSICGQPYYGYGNNAEPINDGRCCNQCNNLVIEQRLMYLYEEHERQEIMRKYNTEE